MKQSPKERLHYQTCQITSRRIQTFYINNFSSESALRFYRASSSPTLGLYFHQLRNTVHLSKVDLGSLAILKIFRIARVFRMARIVRSQPELVILIKGMAAASRAVSMVRGIPHRSGKLDRARLYRSCK